MSDYATFENNPITHSDVLGDVAKITWRTGFLGLGKKHQAVYANGKWVDAKSGSAIDISSVTKKGVQRLMKDYQKLNEIEQFKPVVDEINTTATTVNLKWRMGANGGSQTDGVSYYKGLISGKDKNNLSIFVNAGKYNKDDKELYENGDNSYESYMILGHELGHVWTILTKPTQIKRLYTPKKEHLGANYSEIDAMMWENVLRADAGKGLRLHYYYNKETFKTGLDAKIFINKITKQSDIIKLSDFANGTSIMMMRTKLSK